MLQVRLFLITLTQYYPRVILICLILEIDTTQNKHIHHREYMELHYTGNYLITMLACSLFATIH